MERICRKGFTEGNEYRFGSSNQPAKRLTPKQQAAKVEELLSMSLVEVEKIASDKSSPAILYNCANYMMNGEERKVIEIVEAYRRANTIKRTYERTIECNQSLYEK